MKSRKLFSALLAVMLVLSMCFSSISVSAASVDTTDTQSSVSETVYVTLTGEYVEENGETFIELTIPEIYSSSAMIEYHEYMYCIQGEELDGGTFNCQGNRLTVGVSGENTGASVEIQLKYKGLLGLYYDVSGAKATITCDGTTKTVFRDLVVTPGETYRFSYYQKNMPSAYPKVTLVAVMYTA